MKTILVVLTLTNGQFTETGRVTDPQTHQPFATAEQCNAMVNVMTLMIANRQPDAVGKIRLECKPA